MSVEYKTKNDIPDLYQILGLTSDVCKESNCNDLIQKAYIKKAKACHPDKHPGRKDVEEVFELLTSAYDILKDEKQRNAYNHKLSINKQSSSDYLRLKKGSVDYATTLGEYVPANDQQKLSFSDQMKALDEKHGYNSGNTTVISKQDAKKRLEQIAGERARQDVDLKPEKIFEDKPNMSLFNRVFDEYHKREDGGIVAHNGVPSAWNDTGSMVGYSSFDDLNHLYVEDNKRLDINHQNYGSVDFGTNKQNISKNDIKDLKGVDYYSGHNVLGDDYYKDVKEKLRNRKSDASDFEKMRYQDFKRDETAGYGIFDQLGFKFDDRLALDVDEDDISKKYEKLMAERQQDLLPGNNPSNPVIARPTRNNNRR